MGSSSSYCWREPDIDEQGVWRLCAHMGASGDACWRPAHRNEWDTPVLMCELDPGRCTIPANLSRGQDPAAALTVFQTKALDDGMVGIPKNKDVAGQSGESRGASESFLALNINAEIEVHGEDSCAVESQAMRDITAKEENAAHTVAGNAAVEVEQRESCMMVFVEEGETEATSQMFFPHLVMCRSRSAPEALSRTKEFDDTVSLTREVNRARDWLASGHQCFTGLAEHFTTEIARPESFTDLVEAELGNEYSLGEGTDCPMYRFGRDVGGSLAVGAVSLNEMDLSAERCSICCEMPPGGCSELFFPDRLCPERACKGAFCMPCLEEYYTTAIEGSRYAVPFIRCPTCRGYVRTLSWTKCVDESTARIVMENANSLLILRCSNCDELGSLLTVQVPEDDNSRLVKLWLLSKNFSPEQCQALCEWWERYSFGAVEAKDGISLLCAMVGEVEESLEGEPPDQIRNLCNQLLELIEDVTRRVVLQLAFLRLWPKTFSLCCMTPHCFKCKVSTHHEGVSCEEVQRRQMQDDDIQYCPGCHVPTLKSEGCNGMVCICGECWSWHGDEKWVEEWLELDNNSSES